MRFVTFNICSGRSPADGRVDLDRFAETIAALDADVLSLQEVDRDQPRSAHADLTEIAAAAMNAPHHVFAPALYGTPGGHWTRAGREPQDGPAYGCALLSRLPLRDVWIHRMPAAPVAAPLWVPGSGVVLVREEPRVAVIGSVELGPGRVVTVVGTHLPFLPGWNRRQLRKLVCAVAPRPDPLLVLGDLNLRGTTPARLTGFTDLARAATFPASRPRFQLDHALLRGHLADLGRVTATSAPQLRVSDHRPLVVDIDIDTDTDIATATDIDATG